MDPKASVLPTSYTTVPHVVRRYEDEADGHHDHLVYLVVLSTGNSVEKSIGDVLRVRRPPTTCCHGDSNTGDDMRSVHGGSINVGRFTHHRPVVKRDNGWRGEIKLVSRLHPRTCRWKFSLTCCLFVGRFPVGDVIAQRWAKTLGWRGLLVFDKHRVNSYYFRNR